ncbi:putative aminomethyltransferase protein [Fulvimarina pelagi HTCC2506]|uniref:Putative aminomethyltransferase protein n=1 Tax=Fulvimarina pelagi HTCC2506 TaxID=314231 RepID=Q0G2U3_9HYPH|nr:aminomethyltransferase family protein [Fulvimarina pelagi]EAU42088.1 putative aminomethyltransferase protein [Fulvimarina pelagi HTCC2506]
MTIVPDFGTPVSRGGVLTPAMPILPRGTERHPVPGGGSRALPIGAGDRITIIDREGLQPCELVFFGPDGIADPSRLGARSAGAPDGLLQSFASSDSSARRVRAALETSGFTLDGALCARIFSDGSRAGDKQAFEAETDGLLLVSAPGGPMAVFDQTPPTDIIVYVQRASGGFIKSGPQMHDPLADPLVDINIQPGHAKTYEVRKGQYIQVLDVEGRECSDFQALDIRGVEKGRISDIDPTTTRSLMGHLYPTPGVHSKFFAMDGTPLVEIVQDTCGRHDTFGLACTARYYEEMGYPGHINCSDNINREMDRYGLPSRGGWPAINFFFNTILDDSHAISLDDPWSRPGDYVLLRALTDLVCVSTACPSDIDATNGWNPTEIQVRVYDEKETFEPTKGYRMSAGADLQLTRKTGFHDRFAEHTRNFIEYNGFWLAANFSNHGAIEEYWACRERAAVMDLSALRKFEVTGPDSERLLQHCLTRDMKRLSIGQVAYSAMCYPHGGMVDDGTVFRLGENNFRWICGSDASGIWLREQAEALKLDVWVRSSTDQMHNIAVQGPRSRDILEKFVWTSPTQPTLQELGVFRFTIGRLETFDGRPIVVSRTGYTGELGYEIFCHPTDAEAVFDAVWEAGKPFELTPFGLEALDMVRIEAGLVFAGYEFCDQTNPLEAGIGFTVPLKSKPDDFVGRSVLEERKAHPNRQLVGLDLDGSLVPSHGACVRIGQAQVGEITSAVRSPILGKVIALCRIDATHAEVGTEVEVGQLDGFQKRIPARVVPAPHFDPKKERVKGNYA